MSRNRGAAALKVTEAVPVFAALADATRLGLLGRLSVEGPLSITRLSEGTGVTRQAITRHLYALGGAGPGRPPPPRPPRGRGVHLQDRGHEARPLPPHARPQQGAPAPL